uniref:G-protein coupled receptors family 2 profile 2 domain-containing protein n=1 Tax=Anas platyrhynchos TaxID=8839 RepID=A0A8B9ZF13_ANAPL
LYLVPQDLSRTEIDAKNDRVLTLISYAGCGASSLFLVLSFVSCHLYCFTALLHYFLLAAFTWMCLESVHFYLSLVKVFNIYIPKYILKCCIAGWGIPAIVIIIVLIINKDFYGGGSQSENNPFILLQVHSVTSRTQKRHRFWKHVFLQDVKSAFSLMFLLGLTWGFAFFAWGAVRIFFLYLFSIFNSLQGFFIFVFHCLMKDDVMKQCQVHFCWRRFNRKNYSGKH